MACAGRGPGRRQEVAGLVARSAQGKKGPRQGPRQPAQLRPNGFPPGPAIPALQGGMRRPSTCCGPRGGRAACKRLQRPCKAGPERGTGGGHGSAPPPAIAPGGVVQGVPWSVSASGRGGTFNPPPCWGAAPMQSHAGVGQLRPAPAAHSVHDACKLVPARQGRQGSHRDPVNPSSAWRLSRRQPCCWQRAGARRQPSAVLPAAPGSSTARARVRPARPAPRRPGCTARAAAGACKSARPGRPAGRGGGGERRRRRLATPSSAAASGFGCSPSEWPAMHTDSDCCGACLCTATMPHAIPRSAHSSSTPRRAVIPPTPA